MSTSYDEVAYPGHPHPEARPSRLAAIAALLGFPAAAPDHCRVLELGAGDGAHLIPLALEHPGSSFVGIDLAAKAVERGRGRIRQLGLGNISLEHGDIATFVAREPFDYVLAHGVYSWVPPEVQSALLALCSRALAPDGLAYVSYATYPGCHSREMVRNMMLFHTARLNGAAEEVVSEGLRWARFVAQHQSFGETYRGAIERELERMERHGIGYAFHDDFAEHNAPVYFGQMVQAAREHGLDFLAEALFMYFDDAALPEEIVAVLGQLSQGDRVTREQYLDFLRGRAFRQSLFCHIGKAPDETWALERLRGLHAATSLRSQTPEMDLRAGVVEVFRSEQGLELRADHPFVRAGLRSLGEFWPSSVPVYQLLEQAAALAPSSTEQERRHAEELLLRSLLRAAAARLVELDMSPPKVAGGVSERPCASPLARLEVRDGLRVTDLWQRRVDLEDEASRFLLGLLDGTRTKTELVSAMTDFFRERVSPPPARERVEQQLESVLGGMLRRALLAG